MKYFLIAGEASGDLHGGNLMQELKQADPDARFRFCGGERMSSIAGGSPLIHYKEMAVMGLLEVLFSLRKIAGFLNTCKTELRQWNPDVLIVIDYPGFNLRMAQFAYKHDIRVFYYISPKIWAWKQQRIHKIKRYVNRMFVIFPFEVDFYKRHHFAAEFHGNPLLDEIEFQKQHFRQLEQFQDKNKLPRKPIFAVVAGSRRQEIQYNLPQMLAMEQYFPQYQFVIAGAPGLEKSDYAPYNTNSSAALLFGQTYEILHHAKAAMVTSGTATLETALLNTPQVVCYRMSGGRLASFVKQRILGIGFIALVNIILQQEAITELFQEQMNEQRLIEEVKKIASDSPFRQEMLAHYRNLWQKLGDAGTSRRVAGRMVELLKQS